MARRIVVLVVLVAAAVRGCGESVDLPDRTDPAVEAEEARIAEVLESTDDIWVPGPCEVRLLGQDGTTSYAWANCEGYEANDLPEKSGWGGPVRIDGDRVSQPRDGNLHGTDIREMFPPEIANAIFAGHERIYP
jgi:hypothetical protein